MKRPASKFLLLENSTNLSLGTSDFSRLRQSHKIYVDKTSYIYKLAKNIGGKYFLQRPKQFGKSLLCSTFESLFRNGTRDFKDLYIEDKWEDKGNYHVIRLNFSELPHFKEAWDFKKNFCCYLWQRLEGYSRDFSKTSSSYNFIDFDQWLSSVGPLSIVLIIDDYDAPLRACLNNQKLFIEIFNILYSFYSVVKSVEEAFRFVFITGITRFSEANIISAHTGLNDITLNPLCLNFIPKR